MPASPPIHRCLQPSKQGLSLQAAAWAALEGHMAALSRAFDERDGSFIVDLGGSKRASVSAYKGEDEGRGRQQGGRGPGLLPAKRNQLPGLVGGVAARAHHARLHISTACLPACRAVQR